MDSLIYSVGEDGYRYLYGKMWKLLPHTTYKFQTDLKLF